MSSMPKSPALRAATALALGTTLIGCMPAGRQAVNPLARASATLDKASQEAADAAIAALNKGETERAVMLAERAVGFSPRDAGYRSLLANAYLKAGRYGSAQSSFAEALLLNPGDGRAALSRTLTQIALGDRDGALATLKDAYGRIGAADHGLALALAGDPAGALQMLQVAAREPGADARVRQNLALAHALAGQWEQARVVAAQDVPADELPARMAAWAELARPDNADGQVPTLLGVARATDPGRPERLALIVEPTAPAVAVAAAAPAIAQPEPVAVAPVEAPAPVVAEAPAIVAQAEPAPVANPVAALTVLAAAPVISSAPGVPAVRRTPKPTALAGRYVVQLGAYSSPSRVEQAWGHALNRFRQLVGYEPSRTAVASGAGTLHRLSVSGFATQRQALQVCAQLRRQGGSCFVRSTAGDQPIRLARR